MRTFSKPESDFDETVRLTKEHTDKTAIIADFKVVDTKFGEIGIITTEFPPKTEVVFLTTYSSVLIEQLKEEKKTGFPLKTKIIEVKSKNERTYYSLAEP